MSEETVALTVSALAAEKDVEVNWWEGGRAI